MACALHECCQFFKDNMGDFPQAAEYIKQKLCFGDYERCTRYKVFRETGRGALASLYHPGDEEEVAKISRCLRLKKERTEKP